MVESSKWIFPRLITTLGRHRKLGQFGNFLNFELKYLLKSGLLQSILILGILFLGFRLINLEIPINQQTLPVTWKILDYPAHLISFFITLITFMSAGMLVQRARTVRMDQLVDSTPVSNWVLLLAKFFAILKLQIVLLTLFMDWRHSRTSLSRVLSI